ncbi:MAG: hypothetical protein R3264_10925, partial [Anaerolineae bacterium]|nr:hypothetical protein [Anaerolineae bacterium]
RGEQLALHQVRLANGGLALIGGDDVAGIWPLGQLIDEGQNLDPLIQAWQTAWASLLGVPAQPVLSWESAAIAPEGQTLDGDGDATIASQYAQSTARLSEALGVLGKATSGLAAIDLTAQITGYGLLSLWKRWLRQFAQSSAAYLLANFIDRSGRVQIDSRRVVVTMENRPLDVVLEMAGYLEPIERLVWLDGRDLHFVLLSD